MSPTPHDEFRELCAISTTDQLSGEEQKRPRKRLASCPTCREVMEQYQTVVGETISALASDPEIIDRDERPVQ